MQQNWFTTALIAVLAGALGAVGFGVAGAQSDDGASTEGVTINVDQPGAAAGGSIDGVALVCPGGTGQGGGGAVATGANTNTLANGVVVENENVNINEPAQEQAVITVPFPILDGAPAETAEPVATPETPAAPEAPETPEPPDPGAGTENTPDADAEPAK